MPAYYPPSVAGVGSLGNSEATYSSGQVQFLGSNMVTVQSTTGQGFVFNATQTAQPAVNALGVSNTGSSAGNTGTSSGVTWVIAGSGNLTASQSTTPGGPNTIWLSAAAGAGQPAVNAMGVSNTGTTLGNTGTSSGITFAFGASGNITASQSTAVGGPNTIWFSVPAQTVDSAIKAFGVSNTGTTAGNTGVSTGINWVVAASGNITASQSTAVGGPNTVWLSVPASAAQSTQSAIEAFGVSNTGTTAGNTGVSTGIDWVIAASGGITASQSTVAGGPNTVWLSVPAPGAAAAVSMQYFEADDAQGMALLTNLTAINSRPIFVPFNLKGQITNNSLILQVSRVTNNSNSFTLQAGLYTYANSSSINLLGSLQAVYSNSDTASITANRYLVATGWQAAVTNLTPGAYVLGLNFSVGNTTAMNYSIYGGLSASSPVGYVFCGTNSCNTNNTTWGVVNGWGRYTANSAALPAGVGQSNIFANFSGASMPIEPWFILRP